MIALRVALDATLLKKPLDNAYRSAEDSMPSYKGQDDHMCVKVGARGQLDEVTMTSRS